MKAPFVSNAQIDLVLVLMDRALDLALASGNPSIRAVVIPQAEHTLGWVRAQWGIPCGNPSCEACAT